ncbi:hypothetical protein LY76DRAFT_420520 [Colletotrichum caudatum]|nr:hypothetical protein LY76DRAFT_420520 [Colletotrichum caudatum]
MSWPARRRQDQGMDRGDCIRRSRPTGRNAASPFRLITRKGYMSLLPPLYEDQSRRNKQGVGLFRTGWASFPRANNRCVPASPASRPVGPPPLIGAIISKRVNFVEVPAVVSRLRDAYLAAWGRLGIGGGRPAPSARFEAFAFFFPFFFFYASRVVGVHCFTFPHSPHVPGLRDKERRVVVVVPG